METTTAESMVVVDDDVTRCSSKRVNNSVVVVVGGEIKVQEDASSSLSIAQATITTTASEESAAGTTKTSRSATTTTIQSTTTASPSDELECRSNNSNKNDPLGNDDMSSSRPSSTGERKKGWRPHSQRNRKRPRVDDIVVTSNSNNNQNKHEDDNNNDDSGTTTTTNYHTQIMALPPIHGKQLVHGWVRVITPYPYTYATFAKSRWIGRTILDVYHTEFGSYPQVYYQDAIEQGRIKVHDKNVHINYRIKGGDVLTHSVHRHEPAVAVSLPHPPYVNIIAETPDLVVVDKPCALPIHACGGYHRNALMPLLEEQQHYPPPQQQLHDDGDGGNHNNSNSSSSGPPVFSCPKLYTIHRLDRLTSGLVLLAKSSVVAQQWAKAIQQRSCQKIYLARVQGKFPQHCCLTSTTTLPSLQQHSKQQQLPICGEWTTTTTTTTTNTADVVKEESSSSCSSSIELLRKKHAHGYWIVDGTGTNRPEVTLTDLLPQQQAPHSSSSFTLDEWMDELKNITNATPPSSTTTTSPTLSTTTTRASSMLWLTLACPTRVAQHKDGICEAGAFDDLDDDLYRKTVKPAQTSFAVVQYHEATDSTIVLCRPETGRTHQIRLHLQYLGHAIANDPNYGGQLWYADPDGQTAYSYARAQLDATDEHSTTNLEEDTGRNKDTHSPSAVIDDDGSKPSLCHILGAPTTTDVPATADEMIQLSQFQRGDNESAEEFLQRTCVWCARSRGGGFQRTLLEFLVRSRGIWLHAIQYSMRNAQGELVCYRTAAPDWSQPS